MQHLSKLLYRFPDWLRQKHKTGLMCNVTGRW